METAPELGSEKFTRWAKAVWPYLLGLFGCALIFIDCVLVPPPDTLTSGFGLACISATGVGGLNRFQKRASDDE